MKPSELIRKAYEERCIYYLGTWRCCAVKRTSCRGVDRSCDKYESRKEFGEFVKRRLKELDRRDER